MLATRARERATWWLLFLVLAAMAVLWSLSIPRMGAPDEPAHVVKAVAVAHGNFEDGWERRETGGTLILSVPMTRVRVPARTRC